MQGMQGHVGEIEVGAAQAAPRGAAVTGQCRQRRVRALLCAFALLAIIPGAGAQYAVRNGTVAGGGGVSAAPPYRLVGTVAEPVQGATSKPPYRLISGYPATIGTPVPVVDGLFQDSFENP